MANPKERWVGQSAYEPGITPIKCVEAFLTAEGRSQTDAQVAVKLGVSKSTLGLWRDKHPEFKAAYEYGKTMSEAAYAETFNEKAARSENFPQSWVQYMYERQFGKMPDVEVDASETEAQKNAAYKARVDAIAEKNKQQF